MDKTTLPLDSLTGSLSAQQVLDAFGDGVMVLNREAEVVFWNQWLTIYTKKSLKDCQGEPLGALFPEVDLPQLKRKIKASLSAQVPLYYCTLKSGGLLKTPFRNLTGSGLDHLQQTAALYPLDLEKGWVILALQDQTTLREAQCELQQSHSKSEQAKMVIDLMTGLPNRMRLLQRIHETETPLLAILSIDYFNELNKFYGFEIGEWILKKMSKRLTAFFSLDTELVCKLPSSEYAILSNSGIPLAEWVQRIQTFLEANDAEKFYHEDQDQVLPLSLTIGVSARKKQLLRSADLALKAAQDENKPLLVYDDSMDDLERFEDNIRWAGIVKDALSENRIQPYYQAIVNNESGVPEKYETLVRLIDLEGKAVTPYYFLEVAKKARLYPAITKRVITLAFEDFRHSKAEFSVNVSFEDIKNKDTLNFIHQILVENPDTASRVVFEILESEGIENFDMMLDFIKDVKDLGGKIAIDDFGTGYSNFEYLIKLNVDYLKIDGSLIKNIDVDKNSYLVVETLVEFSKKFGIKTIAEFVDSNKVLSVIKEIGINYSQGFFLAKPLPLNELQQAPVSLNVALNPRELNSFEALLNLAFSEALTVVAGAVEGEAQIGVPIVDFMEPEKLTHHVSLRMQGGKQNLIATQSFLGLIEGEVVFVVEQDSAKNLACLFEHKKTTLVSEPEIQGAVLEFINIVATACIKGFHRQLGLTSKLTKPRIKFEMDPNDHPTECLDKIIMVEAPVQFKKERVNGHLFLFTRLEDSLRDALDDSFDGVSK